MRNAYKYACLPILKNGGGVGEREDLTAEIDVPVDNRIGRSHTVYSNNNNNNNLDAYTTCIIHYYLLWIRITLVQERTQSSVQSAAYWSVARVSRSGSCHTTGFTASSGGELFARPTTTSSWSNLRYQGNVVAAVRVIVITITTQYNIMVSYLLK